MRISIWHRTEEQSPDNSGYYLSYRGFGMGSMSDYDHEHGYMYYDKKTDKWYEYNNKRDIAIVYYWSDATPNEWVDQDPPSVTLRRNGRPDEHVAVHEAWQEVQEALKRYQTVKALCKQT